MIASVDGQLGKHDIVFAMYKTINGRLCKFRFRIVLFSIVLIARQDCNGHDPYEFHTPHNQLNSPDENGSPVHHPEQVQVSIPMQM
jgi:hypothetical protein